jgi:dipeptidyl aminopeptidase/acylaminoacyl peptidase
VVTRGGAIGAFDVGPNFAIFSRSSINAPPDVYRVSLAGGDAKPLTRENEKWLGEVAFSTPESLTVTGATKAQVQYWLIKPPNFDATKKYPVVFLIHGGPQGAWQDAWSTRWNPALWAAQGWVVAAPNPRGSTGFGQKFVDEISQDWGGKVMVDIMAVVDTVAKLPYVDSQRMGIAGASYGGYATLMGAIRHPDMYRCGVAWIAVSDPRLLFEPIWRSDMPREARQYSLPTLVGDPVKDAALLKAAAPVERASEIKIPILMAFGREDRRVPIDHGTRMRAAMKAAGQEPEYVVYDGEGHGWLKVENRIDFWQRVEKFLAKNLN